MAQPQAWGGVLHITEDVGSARAVKQPLTLASKCSMSQLCACSLQPNATRLLRIAVTPPNKTTS
eukprot:2308303-Amphidinium_carterae.1